jgi:hypothetical protein
VSDFGLTEQLVGHRDDVTGLLVLTGWTAGPAGASVVGLADGAVRLWFDHADPSTITELQVDPEADPQRVAAALDPLFPPGWERVAARLTGEPAIVWTVHDVDRVRDLREPGLLDHLARVAQLLAELDEVQLSAVARAIALLELVHLVGELPGELGAEPGSAVADRAATALPDVDPGELAEALDSADAAFLAPTLRSVAELMADGAYMRAADDVERPDEALRVRHLQDMAAAAPMAAGVRRARRAVAPMRPLPPIELPVVIDAALSAEVLGSQIRRDHLEVTVRGASEGEWWLRVFRAGPRPVLLSAVPMQPNTFGTRLGQALLPVGTTAGLIGVDVVIDLGAPLRSDATSRLRRAVRTGRDACRAERVDDQLRAERDWATSAQLWSDTGDERRSRLAHEYAVGGGRSSRWERGRRRLPAQPFAHDR